MNLRFKFNPVNYILSLSVSQRFRLLEASTVICQLKFLDRQLFKIFRISFIITRKKLIVVKFGIVYQK